MKRNSSRKDILFGAFPEELGHYYILQGLLLLSMMFHLADGWNRPLLIIASMTGTALFFLIPQVSQILFTALASMACWRYLSLFPDLANHSNLNLLLFLLLAPFQIRIFLGSLRVNDYRQLLFALRWVILILYFYTFFHKLNWDFIQPDISCSNHILSKYMAHLPPDLDGLINGIKNLTPYLGLLLEGLIPVLLLLKTTRSYGIVFMAALHFLLAPMGFTDFSSLALALAWCFVDEKHPITSKLQKQLRTLALMAIGFELLLGLNKVISPTTDLRFSEGLLLTLLFLPFLWKNLRPHATKELMYFPSSIWFKVPLLLLCLFGASNYLGLRTAGTFSMFSNLKTEGAVSNHMLLPTNPLKIFSFQEDTIEVLEVTPSLAPFYRRMPRAGQLIPKVEFQRVFKEIRKKRSVTVSVSYKENHYKVHSSLKELPPDLRSPWWQTKFLKFRPIEISDGQDCYW